MERILPSVMRCMRSFGSCSVRMLGRRDSGWTTMPDTQLENGYLQRAINPPPVFQTQETYHATPDHSQPDRPHDDGPGHGGGDPGTGAPDERGDAGGGRSPGGLGEPSVRVTGGVGAEGGGGAGDVAIEGGSWVIPVGSTWRPWVATPGEVLLTDGTLNPLQIYMARVGGDTPLVQ